VRLRRSRGGSRGAWRDGRCGHRANAKCILYLVHVEMDAALVETPSEESEDSAAPTLYAAPIITPPTPEELRLAEARKQMLRALDTKITQEDDATALQAIELLEKLVSNILTHPDEPKYREFKASNPAISKKLLKVPGGMEFVNAAGFSTKVVQFEEIWQLHGSGIELTVLEHAQEGLARYKALVHERLQRRSMLTPSEHGSLSTPPRLGRPVPLRASRQDAGQGGPLPLLRGSGAAAHVAAFSATQEARGGARGAKARHRQGEGVDPAADRGGQVRAQGQVVEVGARRERCGGSSDGCCAAAVTRRDTQSGSCTYVVRTVPRA